MNLCVLMALVTMPGNPALAAAHLRCEYLVDPLGIDVLQPRLTWELEATDPAARAVRQSAYRILVAGSRAALDADCGDLWDSGRVESEETCNVVYAGRPLASRAQCFWKVRSWDGDGRASAWSKPGRWTMGLFSPSDWHAQWITIADGLAPQNPAATAWLRKTFDMPQKPQSACLYVAAVGYAEIYLDGRKLDDGLLDPAVCDYRHRAFYRTYDLTPHLGPGRHCLALWLGRGWAAHRPYGLQTGPLAMVALDATLPDGSRVRMASDRTWRCHATPIDYTGAWRFGHFGGEHYDAARGVSDWNLASFDDAAWTPVRVADPPVPWVSAQLLPPNRRMEPIAPVDVRRMADSYVIDLGRNFTGCLEIELSGPRGRTVTLDYSERPVDKPGTRTFGQYDEYVLGGAGREVFRNRFNYHAFRWVTVTGLDKAPRLDQVRAWLVHTDYPAAADFQCSNELLNRICQAVVWTYRSLSLGGYVVDCPHRERLGYGAEGQVAVETGLFHFDQAAMFTKWLGDWRDVQDPRTGHVPHTAPTYIGGGGPAWGGIVVTLPWFMYLQYGDTRILAQSHPTIVRYLEWLDALSHDGLLRPYGGDWDFLADWVAPGRNVAPKWTDTPEDWRIFFNNAYLSYVTQLAGRIADVLGRPAEAAAHRARADRINRALHAASFDPARSTYVNGEQPYLALALLAGMVPEADRAKVEGNLEREILVAQRGHVQAGVLGTWLLLKHLTVAERPDLVLTMALKRDHPSWGYMLDQGATTLWERWDGSESQNHTSFLSIGSWFLEGLAGIRPDPAAPGFKHFFIRPAPVGDLQFARATYRSIRGPITSDWRIAGERLQLTVEIPPNTTATVHLPTTDPGAITESGRALAAVGGVRVISADACTAILRLASGRYTLAAPWNARVSRTR